MVNILRRRIIKCLLVRSVSHSSRNRHSRSCASPPQKPRRSTNCHCRLKPASRRLMPVLILDRITWSTCNWHACCWSSIGEHQDSHERQIEAAAIKEDRASMLCVGKTYQGDIGCHNDARALNLAPYPALKPILNRPSTHSLIDGTEFGHLSPVEPRNDYSHEFTS